MAHRTGRPRLRALALVCVASFSTGCSVRQIAPPAPPPREIPDIPEVPDAPPAEGTGRLLIDSEREPAKVARVTEDVDSPSTAVFRPKGDTVTYAGYGRKTELLCITPCAVDIRRGAHSLVFTSTRDPERTSTVDVAVPTGTTIVRHALGTEKRITGGYFGGALAALGGTGFTLMGALALSIGLTADRTVDEDGNVRDPKEFIAVGAVLGTVGLAALVTGIVLMLNNRPQKQEGSTTTFRLPQNAASNRLQSSSGRVAGLR